MNGQKTLLVCLILLMLLNLVYLDYRTFTKESDIITQPGGVNQTDRNEESVEVQQTLGANYELIWSVIKEATASVTQKVDDLASEQPRTAVSTTTTGSTVKEYYIPLGTGSTASTTRVSINGAEAFVVPANFGSIREIYFEASLRVPTGSGRAYARLKNVTDNVSLFESEVSREGVESGLISSGKIPVPQTTKLYRVELKSSLGAEIKLDNARIKIFVP